jgi:hypothetical protein
MSELIGMGRTLENMGIAGLMIYLIYRLADKWLPKFLAAQQSTAEAMLRLAASVKEGQGEQREMLIAIRVLAVEIGDVKELLRELPCVKREKSGCPQAT